jgi:ribonuclease P protein component
MGQTYIFKKQEKLCGEIAVTELFQRGASFISYPVRVVWTADPAKEAPSMKVMMSVPKKKLKHAVDRNRVKRLLREAYRLNKDALIRQVVAQNLNVRMVMVWLPDEVLDFDKVQRKVQDALGKMQKLISVEHF